MHWFKRMVVLWLAIFVFIIAFVWINSINEKEKKWRFSLPQDPPHLQLESAIQSIKETPSALEQNLIDQGLVSIQSVDSSILIDLKYSGPDNFLGKDVYDRLEKAYMQPAMANKLKKAQVHLKKSHPGHDLLIFDAVRPVSVQKAMWEIVKGTPQQQYVANPTSFSMHNYGMAIDLSIADHKGTPLDMGTEFDHFGPLAQPRYEMDYHQKGILSREQLQNRWLLRNVMKEAGFSSILSEWWHFNAAPKTTVRKSYKVVE